MQYNREQQIAKASNTLFDIVVIGGGATGAGTALDAAQRGYKVLLVEKNDFGAATSGKSTKLIHGGVRYLEQAFKKLSYGQYKMVRKALHERATLLKIAPHITRPLALLTPCNSWLEGAYYFIGLKLYDLLSGRTHVGKSELLGKQKALERLPTLRKENLYNAVLYYDGQLDDLRFNWALIQTAVEQQAICLNHCRVEGFEKKVDGKISAVQLCDALTNQHFSVATRCVINATGPFADNIRLMANEATLPRMRTSKGVHLLLPKHMMPSSAALLIPKTADGRLIFVIPYQKHLLVGTTDEEAPLTENDFGPNQEELNYLLKYVNEYLDVSATISDVTAGFGGLRPLVQRAGGKTKDLVRDHEIEIDNTSGLISILGGKWTTYRLMAKDGVDMAEKILGHRQPSATENLLLCGSRQYSRRTAILLQQQTGWDHECVKHLISKYGDMAIKIGEIATQQLPMAERILPGMPYTWAELQYVLQHEMAYTVKDVLGQRWGTQLSDWQQTLALIPLVGKFMANFYQWTPIQQQLYIDGYAKLIQQMMVESANKKYKP